VSSFFHYRCAQWRGERGLGKELLRDEWTLSCAPFPSMGREERRKEKDKKWSSFEERRRSCLVVLILFCKK
jgi:hypothetical protein